MTSNNPFAAPLIDPKYLSTQFDIVTLREAVRACKRFVTAGTWKDLVLGPWGGLSATSDSAIDAYVRKQSTTVYHPVGTTAMSPRGAKWGVVDPDFKLKGAEGIRIVDAGVWVCCLSSLIADWSLIPRFFPLAFPPQRTYSRTYLHAC